MRDTLSRTESGNLQYERINVPLVYPINFFQADLFIWSHLHNGGEVFVDFFFYFFLQNIT